MENELNLNKEQQQRCRVGACELEYRLISKKGEGTFSEVLKAQSIKTGKFVAIKCMKNHFDSFEQVGLLILSGDQPPRNSSSQASISSPSYYPTLRSAIVSRADTQ